MDLECHSSSNDLRSQIVDVLTEEASQASSGPVRRMLLRSACEVIETQIFDREIHSPAQRASKAGGLIENRTILRVQ